MASFTDEIQKFNPYVEQLPVDDYIKVGMMKQGQYEAGVQAVQGSIDQISGLPITREVDKQYVRSALSQLQDSVKSVAAGDFSNKQLVSQLTNATRKLAKDKNIQAAVLSSTFAQKEQEFMEKQRAEGKLAASNEWDWQSEYQKYLNSGELGTTFQYKYTTYRDVKKKALDILKELKPDAKISDNIFDAKGNLSDAMLREQFKGISPEKIKGALLAGLDQDDLKQLSIDGRYTMSNYDAPRLAAAAMDGIARQRVFIEQKKKQLADTKAGIASVPEQKAIDAKIAELDNESKSIDAEEASYLERLKGNDLDGIRSQLYSQQFLNQFGNAFAFTEISQTYENNPATAVAMKRAEMQQAWNIFEAKYAQDERFHQDDMTMKAAEIDAKKKEALGDLGGTPQTVDQSQLPDVTIANFKSQTDQITKDIATEEAEFLKQNEKDAAWLTQQRALYDQGKEVDGTLKDYFQRREAREKELHSNQALLINLEKEADKNIGTITDLIPKDLVNKNLSIHHPSGTYTYTNEELVEFNNKWSQIYLKGNGGGGAVVAGGNTTGTSGFNGNNTIDDAYAKSILSPKEMALYQVRRAKYFGGGNQESDKQVLNRLDVLNEAVNQKQPELVRKRTEFVNQQLAERTGETQRVAYNVPSGKTEQRVQVRSRVNDLLARASDQKESFGSGTIRADYDHIKEMNDDDNTTYSLVVKDKTQYSDSKYWLRLNNGKNQYQDIPLTPQDKQALFGNRYEGQENPTFSPLRRQFTATGNGSTNFNGTANPIKASATAFFNRQDFQGVRNFAIKGDLVTQGGRYALALYIYDPEAKTYIRKEYTPPAGLMDENQAIAAMNGLSDAAIYQILYDKAPSADDLKKIQELNKKALN